MNLIPGGNLIVPHLVLPERVAKCKGYGWPLCITKYIILTNELGVDVARDSCHSVSADLVIDNDGMPLSNDHVAVQIVELLLEEEVSLEWKLNESVAHP